MTKKQQVVFWLELFLPHIGGVEIFIKQLISLLQQRGYACTVITCASDEAGEGQVFLDGISVYRFDFQRAIAQRDLKTIQRLADRVNYLLKQINPDVLHLNSSQPSTFFYALARKKQFFPTLFTVHQPPDKVMSANSLVGRNIQTADWVVAVSKATLSQVQILVPEIVSRSSVIYNGLMMPNLHTAPNLFDPPKLLCIGRLVEEKGFDLAIRALAYLRVEFPDVRLVIAGDGRARYDLEQQADKLGLGSAVEFTGWCQPEKVPELIDNSSFVLMPSRWEEPFGLVALQAAQRKRPVIASNTGGLPEVVIHNQTGLLFDNGSVTHLTQQIAYLIKHPEEAIAMGNAAQKRAQDVFSLEESADAYHALYQALIQNQTIPFIGEIS